MTKQGGYCKCGNWREVLHRDHIVPKWKGGVDDESNVQYICANCHEEKTLIERKSTEWKAYLSSKLKGIPLTSTCLAAVRAANKRNGAARRGKKLSPEHCAAISAGKKGSTVSPEHRRAQSARMTGKKCGPYKRMRYGAPIS